MLFIDIVLRHNILTSRTCTNNLIMSEQTHKACQCQFLNCPKVSRHLKMSYDVVQHGICKHP